jgi:hypothetical protein
MVYRQAVRTLRCAAMLVCAATVTTAAESDPAKLLQRVAIKVRVLSATLPNYTCVETVNRNYYKPKAAAHAPSCAVVLEQRRHPALDAALRLVLTDRLRLDVALTGRGEIYSWVGASKFEDADVSRVVHMGPIATGSFGALLAIVFGQDPKTFHFEKHVLADRRDLMEYSFQQSQEDSRYKLKTKESWVYTAYRGTFQLDPETEDVVRLTLETAELPPAAGTCQTATAMEFGLVRIGAGQFLLAKQGQQRFVDINGDEVENTTTFAACREYRGESTITFSQEPAPVTHTGGTSAAPSLSVPAGLPFTFELTTPIAADTAAGGDPFAGRLVTALRDQNRKIIAPAHAMVEGRLLRLEIRRTVPAAANLVLNLRTVEIGGVRVPLAADRNWPRVADGKRGKTPVLLPFSWERHAAVFQLAGDHAVMKAGSRSEWLTVPASVAGDGAK